MLLVGLSMAIPDGVTIAMTTTDYPLQIYRAILDDCLDLGSRSRQFSGGGLSATARFPDCQAAHLEMLMDVLPQPSS